MKKYQREKILQIMFLLFFVSVFLVGCGDNAKKNNQSKGELDSVPQQINQDNDIKIDEVELPHFWKHLINPGDKYEGEIVPIDIESNPRARLFRTNLRHSVEINGINFAHYYSLAELGMSTGIQEHFIVDMRDGEVYTPDLISTEGIRYETNSGLIIVNPIDNIVAAWGNDSSKWPEHLYTYYYLWEDNELKLLRQVRVTYNIEEEK